MNNSKFQVGTVYQVQSICDSGCMFSYKVIRRTEKSVWLLNGTRKPVTLDSRGVEQVYPEGRYSMAPRIVADRNEVK